jgi:hypothetical protein
MIIIIIIILKIRTGTARILYSILRDSTLKWNDKGKGDADDRY